MRTRTATASTSRARPSKQGASKRSVARLLAALLLALVAVPALAQSDLSEAQDAWLQSAGLGPYQPEVEDYDAIYEAAKAEGSVSLLSLSSRFPALVEAFEAAYPGITVEAFDLGSTDQVDKLIREQNAQLYTMDVLFFAGENAIRNELLPQNMIWNYVPTTTYDGKLVADLIPEALRQPLLVHSLESKVVFYNFETYPDGAPVDNLWDLTRPEWRGRVQMKDPLQTEENMNFLAGAVQHADAMAAAYEQEFGEPITLSRGVENAGYEWIKRLKDNDLVLTSSDGDVSDAVGAPGQTQPPLGLSVAGSKIRDNADGLKLMTAWDMTPTPGLVKANYIVIANQAPHPNAAKLLVRFMLGDADGGLGFAPWHVSGQWSARSDVPVVVEPVTNSGDVSLDELTAMMWQGDPDWLFDHGLEVRDFWMGL